MTATERPTKPIVLDLGFRVLSHTEHTPTVLVGFAVNDWEARDAFARTLDAAPADPINQTETDSKLIVPSAECWRRAFDELIDREWCFEHPIFDDEWAAIEQRAIELAREGK